MSGKPTLPRVIGVSRRRLLGFVGIGLVSSLMSPLSFDVFAAEQSPIAANLEKFMLVSRALTAKPHLNPLIGQRIYQALQKRQPGIDALLAKLQPLPNGAPTGWPQEQQTTARQILQAWYLGKVGDGPQADVISYEHALMFDAVSDVLVIRSYCPNQPGYWAAKPATTI